MPSAVDADLAIAIQAAKGTPSVISSQRLFLLGGGVEGQKDINDVEETSGSFFRNTAFVGAVRGGGTASFAVKPASVGLLLYLALGAKSVSGAGDPWTHVFTPHVSGTSLPWCTVWRRLASGLYERFSDCKVNSLAIRSQYGGIVAVEVTFMALTPANKTAAEATAAVETATTAVFVHGDGQGQLLFEGSVAAEIGRAAFVVNNNLAAQPGDGILGFDLVEQVKELTAETDHTITDFQMYRKWMYGTGAPADNAAPTRVPYELTGTNGLDFKWSRPGSPARSLQIQTPRVQLVTPGDHPANPSGAPFTETRQMKVYAPAAGAAITATLLNGQSSYVAS